MNSRGAKGLKWTAIEVAKLRELARSGASPHRTAAALHRPTSAVKIKARRLGEKFKPVRQYSFEHQQKR